MVEGIDDGTVDGRLDGPSEGMAEEDGKSDGIGDGSGEGGVQGWHKGSKNNPPSPNIGRGADELGHAVFENMLGIIGKLKCSFHSHKSWLKLVASSNMKERSSPDVNSQLERSWSSAEAPLNL